MERSIDDVIADLAQVQDALLACDDDAFDQRSRLRLHQEELRAEADNLRAGVADSASLQQLEDQLEHLYRRREELQRVRPTAASAGSGGGGRGGGGIDPHHLQKLRRDVDAATGWDKLIDQIHRLEARRRALQARSDREAGEGEPLATE